MNSGRITRVRSKERFTALLNETIRNDELSWKARGILAYLLSLPPDWELHKTDLHTKSKKDGRDGTSAGFDELVKSGYIVVTPVREKGKFKGYNYDVYEIPAELTTEPEPITENPESVETENPITDKPITEKPFPEKPFSDKPISENTELLNTIQNKIEKEEQESEKNETGVEREAESLPAEVESEIPAPVYYGLTAEQIADAKDEPRIFITPRPGLNYVVVASVFESYCRKYHEGFVYKWVRNYKLATILPVFFKRYDMHTMEGISHIDRALEYVADKKLNSPNLFKGGGNTGQARPLEVQAPVTAEAGKVSASRFKLPTTEKS